MKYRTHYWSFVWDGEYIGGFLLQRANRSASVSIVASLCLDITDSALILNLLMKIYDDVWNVAIDFILQSKYI